MVNEGHGDKPAHADTPGQMPRNSLLMSEWKSNQVNSHSTTLLSPYDLSRVYFYTKCEWKIKFQGCKLQTKRTKAKSEPGLITINIQVVFLLDISNQFKLISYIELNSMGPGPIP